jgi:hypothetical protein
MYRIMTPTPTRGPAPSHSPPDTNYQPGRKLTRFLGWFSIGLGVAELVAPRALSELTGIRSQRVLQAYGFRELVCGVGILQSNRPAAWVVARVVGDVLDLSALAEAGIDDDGQRRRAIVSALAVAGVALLDVVNSAQLTAAEKMQG